MDTFLSVLLDPTFPIQQVEINSLRLNKNKEMSRMKTLKNSLSDIFLKMRVHSDAVTCEPLVKDGKIM